MDRLIDWQLYSNNDLIVDLKNVPALYKENDYLLFLEDGVENKIDIVNKKYHRVSNEYEMLIDFKEKLCYFILPNNEEFSTKLDGNILIDNKKIIINYNIDGIKRILIKIKD